MGWLSWDKWKETRRKTGRVGGKQRSGRENSRAYSAYVHVQSLSRVRLFATLWTMALQAPLSTEFSRQEYKNGLPFTSPGDLPDPGIEPTSPEFPALATGTTVPPGKPLKSRVCVCECSVALVVSNSLQLYELKPARLLVHGIFQGRIL